MNTTTSPAIRVKGSAILGEVCVLAREPYVTSPME